jgi:hypothetical protein
MKDSNYSFMISRDDTNLPRDSTGKPLSITKDTRPIDFLTVEEKQHLPEGQYGVAYVGTSCPPGFKECPCNKHYPYGKVKGVKAGCGYPYIDEDGEEQVACTMCPDKEKVYLEKH